MRGVQGGGGHGQGGAGGAAGDRSGPQWGTLDFWGSGAASLDWSQSEGTLPIA